MSFKLINKDVFREYNLLLVSAGGSGCTHIHKLLDNFKISKNNTNDEDYLKHLSSPNQSLYSMNRYKSVVYIYNDPLLSIASHYHRGWSLMQHKKIIDCPEKLNIDEVSDIERLQKYTLEKKMDIFGVHQHFMNWVELSKTRSNFAVVDFRNRADVVLVFEQLFDKKIDYSIKDRSPKTNNLVKGMDQEFVDFYKTLDQNNIKLIDEMRSLRKMSRVN